MGGEAACCSPGAEGGKRRLCSLVLDSLPQKIRDKGVKSKKYKLEEPLFLALALKTFNKSMNAALMDARLLTMLRSELAERRQNIK